MTPVELERLVADLEAGVYDAQLSAPVVNLPPPAQLQRFSELRPFDVKAWAERKGLKLPQR
jgi:hypothetical protein